ncbi:aminoacyl-tRNA hydrolase [Rhodocytophaga rosea]|uniref:Aminoacyl-tRNA hydrolase n=1 Tax=Rhodocytophaga rosea TaxID=2704465 RepID=A0A6C0GCD2_9BACT|nr:alternative ribosome rescue aminoacyl-tRNA hydrolase ArfB [Rhodocytophaga rosea]QHT65649.1 aminoacyl-tRNA hydrolase [Rhodocytophaga rosea]
MNQPPHQRDFSSELHFATSRSGGAGGQHVNKVSSKVELRFHVDNSAILGEEEKQVLKAKLANKINGEGYLQLISQAERSQLLNKQQVVKKFYQLLEKSFRPVKARKATKPTAASIQERITDKKRNARKKATRNRDSFNDDL